MRIAVMAAVLAAAVPGGAAAQDFEGGYVGLGVGGVWTDWERNPCCPGPVDWRAEPMISVSTGYDFRAGQLAYGIEADASLATTTAESTAGFGPWEQNVAASLRARVGYVTGRTMVFGTAGYGGVRVSVPGDEEWVYSPIFGAGVESFGIAEQFGFPANTSVEAEVLYQQLEETSLSQDGGAILGSSDNVTFRIGVNLRY